MYLQPVVPGSWVQHQLVAKSWGGWVWVECGVAGQQGWLPEKMLTCKGSYVPVVQSPLPMTTATAATSSIMPASSVRTAPQLRSFLTTAPTTTYSIMSSSSVGSFLAHMPIATGLSELMNKLMGPDCQHQCQSVLVDLARRSQRHFLQYEPRVTNLLASLKFPRAVLVESQPNCLGEMHPGRPSNPTVSIYSDLHPEVRLAPSEWIRIAVRMQVGEDRVQWGDYFNQASENLSLMCFYHGCPFGAVLGMINEGGFIPGEGTCTKKSRRVAGCFCSQSFWEAFDKGRGHMLDFI